MNAMKQCFPVLLFISLFNIIIRDSDETSKMYVILFLIVIHKMFLTFEHMVQSCGMVIEVKVTLQLWCCLFLSITDTIPECSSLKFVRTSPSK